LIRYCYGLGVQVVVPPILIVERIGGDAAIAGARSGAYAYNGLHQRVTRLADELADLDGDEDSLTRYYYDGSWRLVEESTVEIETDDLGSSLTQRVWSPHSIDALIFTQTETVDTTGHMWSMGHVGVFPSYPFPEGLERMREGGC